MNASLGECEQVPILNTILNNPLLNSVNGNITLTIPSDANAQLRAGTLHGAISNEFGLPVNDGRYIGYELNGQLGAGGPRIKLGNVNGAITIKHAGDGRPVSQATSLLSDKDKDKDDKSAKVRVRTREIERQVRQSDYLVVFLSAASSHSEMVKGEIEIARDQAAKSGGKPRVLPVRVAFDSSLPYPLNAYLDKIQYVHWRSESDTAKLLLQLAQRFGNRVPNDEKALFLRRRPIYLRDALRWLETIREEMLRLPPASLRLIRKLSTSHHIIT
jgi:hypothetical protein